MELLADLHQLHTWMEGLGRKADNSIHNSSAGMVELDNDVPVTICLLLNA